MADESTSTTAAAPEDAAKVRAEYEAKIAAERQEAAKNQEALKAQWAAERQQIAAYLRAQHEEQQRAKQPQPPAEDDDPDSVITRKELKKALEGATTMTGQAIGQQQLVWAKNQRSLHRQLASQTLPDFSKHAAAIDALLDRVDPMQAAAPTAYQEVYEVVYGKALIAEQRKAAEEARKRKAEEREDERAAEAEDEAPEREPDYPREAPRPRPTPTGDAVGVRAATTQAARRRLPPLSRDDEYAVRRYFGGDAERYRTYKSGEVPDEDFDFFGAKGRTKF